MNGRAREPGRDVTRASRLRYLAKGYQIIYVETREQRSKRCAEYPAALANAKAGYHYFHLQKETRVPEHVDTDSDSDDSDSDSSSEDAEFEDDDPDQELSLGQVLGHVDYRSDQE